MLFCMAGTEREPLIAEETIDASGSIDKISCVQCLPKLKQPLLALQLLLLLVSNPLLMLRWLLACLRPLLCVLSPSALMFLLPMLPPQQYSQLKLARHHCTLHMELQPWRFSCNIQPSDVQQSSY